MCARYGLVTPISALQEEFGFDHEVTAAPRYNIAPGQQILTITGDDKHHATWARFGAGQAGLINARAETIDEKPLFSRAIRAVVPADFFYEWDGARGPHVFEAVDGGLLRMAALFFPETSECVLVTAAASDTVRPIHDRMPLLLAREEAGPWLARASAAADLVARPAVPALRRRAVDPAVNDARREGPGLLSPPRQQSLFG